MMKKTLVTTKEQDGVVVLTFDDETVRRVTPQEAKYYMRTGELPPMAKRTADFDKEKQEEKPKAKSKKG